MDVDTFLETVRHYTGATTITKRMVVELIQYIDVYPAVDEGGITNQRVTVHYNCICAFEVPDRRKISERDILLETRKGVALSYAPTHRSLYKLGNKKAEYHQQTFSDPLMILLMVGVARLELAASCSQSRRATNCATPRYKTPVYIQRCCNHCQTLPKYYILFF